MYVCMFVCIVNLAFSYSLLSLCFLRCFPFYMKCLEILIRHNKTLGALID